MGQLENGRACFQVEFLAGGKEEALLKEIEVGGKGLVGNIHAAVLQAGNYPRNVGQFPSMVG